MNEAEEAYAAFAGPKCWHADTRRCPGRLVVSERVTPKPGDQWTEWQLWTCDWCRSQWSRRTAGTERDRKWYEVRQHHG